MKKICIVCPYNYPIPAVKGGAIEQIVEDICKVNEKERGLYITVLVTHDEIAEKQYNDYQYTKFVPFKIHSSDKLTFFLFRVVKKLLHFYIPTSLRMLYIKRWIQQHRHDFDYFIYEDGLSYMLGYLFKGVDRNKVFNHLHWVGDPNYNSNEYFSHLLPVSQYVGNVWIQKCSTPSVSTTVLKNGIQLENFQSHMTDEQKNILRQELGIPTGHFVVLYVGRIVQEKGVLQLLRAFDSISDKDITLLLIGAANFAKKVQTPYEIDVMKKVQGMKHSIVQLGFIKNVELYRYQSISDIAVIPTICEEAASLAAVEHMAAGLPLIITDSGGLPEYADNSCAIMVSRDATMEQELSEAIVYLKEHDEVCQTMSENARITSQKYSIEKTYIRLIEIISSLGEHA